MAAKDSAFYAAYYTNKYLGDRRNVGAFPVRIPIDITVDAPSVNGDTYNLFVIPANAKVMAMELQVATANAASSTVTVGDAGNASRYIVSSAMVAITDRARLANTGAGYTPIADTVVFATLAGATPTIGARIFGFCDLIPAH